MAGGAKIKRVRKPGDKPKVAKKKAPATPKIVKKKTPKRKKRTA